MKKPEKFEITKIKEPEEKNEKETQQDNMWKEFIKLHFPQLLDKGLQQIIKDGETGENDTEFLYSIKLSIAKEIITGGKYNREETLNLLDFLNSLIILPEELESKFYYDEVKKMSFKQETGKDLLYPPPVEITDEERDTCPECKDYFCIDSDGKGNSYYECWNCGWIEYISPEKYNTFMNRLNSLFESDI